jgi:hypothetical protein
MIMKVPGTVRLFYGFIISASIGFGLDIGTLLFGRIFGLSTKEAYDATQCEPDRGISTAW